MAQNFREFELSGWQTVASPYHDYFGKLTQQTIEPLLKGACVKSGDTVLDVASGPGYVAFAAAALGADVIGVDFSKVMVENAKQRYGSISFLEGDAQELPFENDTFNCVLMNFGILHLDHP